MTDVEQRVVQMRFDDKEFDEKAKKTMKTLDKLNEKLSFDAVAQKSDAALNEMVGNVEKIADKAYTIVDRVIDKIKDNIATKLVDFIEEATVGQVAKGWSKYADMSRAIGTMISQGHKIDDVTNSLEKLAFFADETSYSFNDMISNIAKFTATGVSLEDATEALMGISNWAAMSGQNAETASRAFFQLSQAMGSYMQKKDWVSVQTANMDTQEFRQTALDTAVALGTLRKTANDTYVSLRGKKAGSFEFTAQQFVESLTEGAWFTSDVMVETYKKYSEAVDKIYQLYNEGQGKVSASEILHDLKEQNKDLLNEYQQINFVNEETADRELNKWSKIKKATADDITNYAKLKNISEELAAEKLNSEYISAVQEYAKQYGKSIDQSEKELERWSEYTASFSLKAFVNAQEARTFKDVIESVTETASTAWLRIYEQIFGNYEEAKKLWTDMSNGLIDIFVGRLYDILDVFKEWKAQGGRNVLWQGMYAFGYGFQSLIENIRESWDELFTNGDAVGKLMSISNQVQEAGFKFYMFMKRLGESDFYKNITQALFNIKNFIETIVGALRAGVRDAIPGGNIVLNFLVELSGLLKDITSNFKLSDAAVDGLRRTFKGLTIILLRSKKTFMDLLVKIILPLLNAAFEVLGEIVEVVLTITGTIGDIIEYFIPLNKEGSSLVTILQVLTEVLKVVITYAGKIVVFVLKSIVPVIGMLIGFVVSLVDSLATLFNGTKIKMGSGSAETKLAEMFGGLKQAIESVWEPLESFQETIDKYKEGKGLINFLNLFADISEGIGNRILLTIDAILGFIEVASESKLGKALGYIIKGLRYLVRGAMWLFNNLFVPVLKEIIIELGMTVESVKGIIDERGILGLLHLIQQVFKTGIFGELARTIDLINGVIGGNGVGKLFNKGAKALESMSKYFNAMKMDAAANVMLKIVAALGILYALLALITFLPVDKYEEMQKAMIDMGIALGAIVGGIFLISAAAALAGGNLVAMAAGFVGVAVAIGTALWALRKMVEFTKSVNEEQINHGMEVLTNILRKYGLFLLQVLTPLIIVGSRYKGDIGGIGISMAGIAASIWILIKSLEGMDRINVNNIDKLFEFISGIYLVLSASTSLLIYAARGETVHGFSIAIASLGVGFTAIKMILPLCRDVIAEQNTFMDGADALTVFSVFMIGFAASMHLIVSAVDGLISSLASILILRLYIQIVTDHIMPLMLNFIRMTVNLTKEIYNGVGDNPLVGAIPIFIGELIAFAALIGGFALLEHAFGDVSPLTFLFIGATIVGVIAAISNFLIPAFEQLTEFVGTISVPQFAGAVSILGLMFAPVFSLANMFKTVVESMETILDSKKGAKSLLTVNAGIITRNFNAVSSIMQSIMLAVLGVYAGILGILALVKSMPNPTSGQFGLIITMFGGATVLILSIVVPISNMFNELLSTLTRSLKNGGSINKGIIALTKTQDTLTAVITSIVNIMQVLTIFITGFMVAAAGLAFAIEGNALEGTSGKIGWIMGFIGEMALLAVGIVVAFSKLIDSIMSPFENEELIKMGTKSSPLFSALKATAVAISILGIGIALMVGEIGYFATSAAKLDNASYNKFIAALIATGLVVAGIMYATSKLFEKIMDVVNESTTSVSEHTFNDSYRGIFDSTKTVLRGVSELIVTMAGLVGTIISIGIFILPQLEKLEKISIDKIFAVFVGIIASVFSAVGVLAMVTKVDESQNAASTFDSIMSTIRMFLAMVVPFISLGIALKMIFDSFAQFSNMNKDKVAQMKWIVGIVGVVALVINAIASVTKDVKVTSVFYIVALGALLLALGGMYKIAMSSLKELKGIDENAASVMMWFIGILGLISVILTLVGSFAGKSALGLAGIGAVAVLCLAIGGAALMIAYAAEKIYAIYKDWSGINDIVSKLASYKKATYDNEGYALGIEDSTDKVLAAIDKRDKAVEDRTAKNTQTFSPSKLYEWYGKMQDLGLAKGITRNTKPVIRAIDSLADITQNVFEDDLQIASPSKVFYKDGRFIVAGIENGVKSQKSSLSETMSNLGDTLASSFENSVKNITMPEIDIWGGKDPKETIEGWIGDIDGSTIIGKLFGFNNDDGLMTKEMYLWYENYKKMGNKLPKEIEDQMERTRLEGFKADSFGDKIFNKLTSPAVKEKIVAIGAEFGLDLSGGLNGDSVLEKIKEEILADDGIVSKIGDAISTGDWTSVGGQICGGVLGGIDAALDKNPITKTIKDKIKSLFNVGESNENNNGNGGKNLSTNPDLEFDSNGRVTDEAFSKLIKKNITIEIKDDSGIINPYAFGEGKRTLKFRGDLQSNFEKVYKEKIDDLEIVFDESIDPSKLFEAIESEDTLNRLARFYEFIYQGAEDSIIKGGDHTIRLLSANDIAALKQMMKDWGVASPSKVMRDLYENVYNGAIVGINDKAPNVVEAMKDTTSEQYEAMSLGVQAIDELASGVSNIHPEIAPIFDTTDMVSGINDMNTLFGPDPTKVAESLNYTGSISSLANAQMAMAGAVDRLRADILGVLNLGELVKIENTVNVNDDRLFDRFVNIDRQKYNRTGSHAW